MFNDKTKCNDVLHAKILTFSVHLCIVGKGDSLSVCLFLFLRAVSYFFSSLSIVIEDVIGSRYLTSPFLCPQFSRWLARAPSLSTLLTLRSARPSSSVLVSLCPQDRWHVLPSSSPVWCLTSATDIHH